MSCITLHPELTMLAVSGEEIQALAGAGTGQFSDGVLTVNLDQYSGTAFSWKSNISIDCLFARTSDGGGRFITYDQESLGEDGVSIDGTITFLSFCYDLAPAQTPTPAPTTTPGLPDTSLSRTDPTTRTDSGGLLLGLLTILVLSAGLWIGGISRSRRRALKPALVGQPWSTQASTSWHMSPTPASPRRWWHR